MIKTRYKKLVISGMETLSNFEKFYNEFSEREEINIRASNLFRREDGMYDYLIFYEERVSIEE
jgi:hypothetical protein